jgi:hypothetical protein
VRRDVGEKVPACALDRLQLRLIQDKFAELLARGTQRDEVRPDLLTRDRVDGMDPPVELTDGRGPLRHSPLVILARSMAASCW